MRTFTRSVGPGRSVPTLIVFAEKAALIPTASDRESRHLGKHCPRFFAVLERLHAPNSRWIVPTTPADEGDAMSSLSYHPFFPRTP